MKSHQDTLFVKKKRRFNFREYQIVAARTAVYPEIGHSVVYPALGLANEAGEVLGKIKKIFRDKGGVFEDADKKVISKELGDVLWYISQVANELGIDLEDVAEQNIHKLLDRKERGVIQGSGDER